MTALRIHEVFFDGSRVYILFIEKSRPLGSVHRPKSLFELADRHDLLLARIEASQARRTELIAIKIGLCLQIKRASPSRSLGFSP